MNYWIVHQFVVAVRCLCTLGWTAAVNGIERMLILLSISINWVVKFTYEQQNNDKSNYFIKSVEATMLH